MAEKLTAKRNRRNGQYTFDGDFSRLCVCGHTLGVHAGEAPHDCLAGTGCLGDPRPALPCDCQRFRPAGRAALNQKEDRG